MPVEHVARRIDPCVSTLARPISVPWTAVVRDGSAVALVSVKCGEHVPVVLPERVVVDVAWEPVDCQLVVVGLVSHDERAVLCPEPRRRALLLYVKPQLAAGVLGESMNQLVTQPEVAARTAEPNAKLVPRSIEEIRVVNVLLYQYGRVNAVVYNR